MREIDPVRLIFSLCLVVGTAVTSCRRPTADPPPAWQHGATRTAIEDSVARVTPPDAEAVNIDRQVFRQESH